MDPGILLIGTVVVLAILASGIPFFVGFIVINATGLLLFFGTASVGLFTNSIVSTLTNESLISIPMFTLMGEFLFRSGAVDALYDAINKLIVRSRIRLYILGLSVSATLGSVSGSAIADAAMFSKSLYPAMVSRGYNRQMSAGLILAGAILAPVIPPSIHAVLLGTIANVSIAEMLLGGIGPGLLITAAYFVYIKLRVWRDPSLAPAGIQGEAVTAKGVRQAVVGLIPFTSILFLVMGLIMFGIATPDESAAVGAIGSMLMAAYYRRFTLRLLWDSLMGTVRISSMIFVVVASASLFAQLLAFTGVTHGLVGILSDVELNQWVIYTLMLVIAALCCMFIGPLEFMLIAIPIYSPIIAKFGWDPIWFYNILLVVLVTGGLTPPMGMAVFVFHSVTREPLGWLFRAAAPWVGVIAVCVFILTLFPQIVRLFIFR
ncbi:MAG: TRAP transporter large permease subunit [Burkholderiaceae bacterium]